jgi:hypothetical protein
MSIILETTTVKETLFSDFKGEIKACAWGGDFVMVISESDPTAYFSEKVLRPSSYDEMILT